MKTPSPLAIYYLIATIVILCLWTGIGIVACHFIKKYW
jgi:hypothetical protein